MAHEVTVTTVHPRPTAVVPATTTWPEFRELWRPLLDQVWSCVDAAGASRRCRNVMLYLDETPRVEVGVERLEPFTLRDPVVESALPGGPVAMTVHHGPYAGLDDAHAAVHTWAEREDRTLAGPRWEVYGHVEPANEFVTIEIYYLLA